MILARCNPKKPIPPPINGSCSRHRLNAYECEYIAVKMSKRGNDVHCYKVRKKLKPLLRFCYINKDVEYLNEKNDRAGFSKLLMITLTYDPMISSLNDAWLNIGEDLNRFLSSIKQEYGKIFVLRCFEAFTRGGSIAKDYPHIHMLILFKDKNFPVFRYRAKKDNKIHFKLCNEDLSIFQNSWHSYLKCEGVKSLGGIGYILKYITKEMHVQNNYRTSALLWLYHKQSYSMSKDFLERIIEYTNGKYTYQLDTIMCNSNKNDKNIYSIYTFMFVCIVLPKKKPDKWFIELKPPPIEIFEEADYETIFEVLVEKI